MTINKLLKYTKYNRFIYLMHIQLFKGDCNGCIYSFTQTFENTAFFL